MASVYHLPVADESVDLLFTSSPPCVPRSLPGCCVRRILLLRGSLRPPPVEMKSVLYDKPYENAVKREDYPGFQWLEAVPLRYTVHLDCAQDIMALFGMTPYAGRPPRRGGAAVRIG